MKKMITKTFQHKGQMINYYNKVKNNLKIEAVWCGYFAEFKSYAIQYVYR